MCIDIYIYICVLCPKSTVPGAATPQAPTECGVEISPRPRLCVIQRAATVEGDHDQHYRVCCRGDVYSERGDQGGEPQR